MGIPIYQVDAFTHAPFLGNPAAVCLLPGAKDAGWMQHVAREMNLSETAFLVQEDDGFSLHWFTPVAEVDLCGHATLASAHILWETGIVNPEQKACFHTLSGLLTARREGNWIELDFPAEPGEEVGILPAFDALDFLVFVKEKMKFLGIDDDLVNRAVNVGFSGGEKKRNEIFQMAVLEPKLAILDETDSGLDIDALKLVATGVNALRSADRAIIVVTHYQRLLNYIVPDFVHVLSNGRMVKSGGKELALELEQKGYVWLEEAAESGQAVTF